MTKPCMCDYQFGDADCQLHNPKKTDLQRLLPDLREDLWGILADECDPKKTAIAMLRYCAREADQQNDYKQLLREFKIDFDINHDAWGHTMGAFFDVAGEMYERDMDIPDAWNYTPGLEPVNVDSYFARVYAEATDEALTKLGGYFHKITEYLEKAGKSY